MTNPSFDPSSAADARARGAWRRRFLVGGAFAATFAAGALASAVAPAVAVAQAGMSAGMGMGMHGANPAAMHAMMEAHINKMLASVGATADQSARIRAILASAMGSLGPIHARMAADHQQFHTLLTAPTVDRAALERARAQGSADFDQASKVLTGALADAAQVLSPEQRAKLGAEMASHGHHMAMSAGGL